MAKKSIIAREKKAQKKLVIKYAELRKKIKGRRKLGGTR